jgi:hypothetical protein
LRRRNGWHEERQHWQRHVGQQGKIGVRYGTEKSTLESRNIKAQPAIHLSW